MGDKWNGRAYEDISSMNIVMTQVDVELNEEINNWCENRSGWVNDRIKNALIRGEVQIRIIVT